MLAMISAACAHEVLFGLHAGMDGMERGGGLEFEAEDAEYAGDSRL